MIKKIIYVACSLCFLTVNAGNPVSFWKPKVRVADLSEQQSHGFDASCPLALGGLCALLCCADRWCRDEVVEGARVCCGADAAQNCAMALNAARAVRVGLMNCRRLGAPELEQMHRD